MYCFERSPNFNELDISYYWTKINNFWFFGKFGFQRTQKTTCCSITLKTVRKTPPTYIHVRAHTQVRWVSVGIFSCHRTADGSETKLSSQGHSPKSMILARFWQNLNSLVANRSTFSRRLRRILSLFFTPYILMQTAIVMSRALQLVQPLK